MIFQLALLAILVTLPYIIVYRSQGASRDGGEAPWVRLIVLLLARHVGEGAAVP